MQLQSVLYYTQPQNFVEVSKFKIGELILLRKNLAAPISKHRKALFWSQILLITNPNSDNILKKSQTP